MYTLATRPLLISTSLHQSVAIAQSIPLAANGASPRSAVNMGKRKHPELTAACVRMWCIGTLSLISIRFVHKAFTPNDGFTLTTQVGYNNQPRTQLELSYISRSFGRPSKRGIFLVYTNSSHPPAFLCRSELVDHNSTKSSMNTVGLRNLSVTSILLD